MFACFGLKRLDVFSTGDLGVQRGMAAFKGRDVSKLKNGKGKWKYMSEQEMEETADKFRPYRYVETFTCSDKKCCAYLWNTGASLCGTCGRSRVSTSTPLTADRR